jgi:hypothetical protein
MRDQRIIFACYLGLIVAGLLWIVALGVLHR